MYPSKRKLVNLSDALKDIQDMKVTKNKSEFEETIRDLLRMVVAPVALGLDALHCPVPSKR